MTATNTLDREPIASAIDDLADDLIRRAEVLRAHAKSFRETGDMDEVSSALTAAVSTANMRLDLLVSRPARQLQRIVDSKNEG